VLGLRRHVTVVVVLGIMAGVIGVVTGCGGDAKGMVAATGIDVANYSSQQYGYSFRYPTRCTLIQPTPDAASDPGLAEQVLVADPSGMVVDGAALDAFSVSVFGLSRSAGPTAVEKHKAEFERIALGLVGRPSGLRVVAPPSVASLGGQPAISTEYFSRIGAERVGTVAYLVPRGEDLFWVRLQSSRKTKGSSTLVVALSTFKFQ
jgi:hypothetical protein